MRRSAEFDISGLVQVVAELTASTSALNSSSDHYPVTGGSSRELTNSITRVSSDSTTLGQRSSSVVTSNRGSTADTRSFYPGLQQAPGRSKSHHQLMSTQNVSSAVYTASNAAGDDESFDQARNLIVSSFYHFTNLVLECFKL